MIDKFTEGLHEKCIALRLHETLNINPKTYYDLQKKGVIPLEGTYQEVLGAVLEHYKRTKTPREGATTGLERLLEAEKIQKIRVDKAKEEQILLNTQIVRGRYVSVESMVEVLAPFMLAVRSTLLAAANLNPQVSPYVDSAFTFLTELGERLLSEAKETADAEVKGILDTPVDIEGIMELQGVLEGYVKRGDDA